MKEFRDKVAVITGAASGIGRGIAERCAEEGMRVVLADIKKKTLGRTEKELVAKGATVLSVLTDVSKAREVERLAKKAIDTFGAVHMLYNNAGVGAGGSIWESSLADWEWVMGVNLWGVIHGIRVFVPIMLSQDFECHVINTASIVGLSSHYPVASYHVTKHAVVALSEQLFHSLAQRDVKVKVSVLCPGSVKTQILDSTRNLDKDTVEAFRQAIKEGMSPYEVADCVFAAIEDERFYISTHPEFDETVRVRMEDILQRRNPSVPTFPGELDC